MDFSILFPNAESRPGDAFTSTDVLDDLALSPIITAVVTGHDEYELPIFFDQPLKQHAAILYRQAVFRDLERRAVRNAIEAFASGMRKVRERLRQAQQAYYPRQGQRWHVDASSLYCQIVVELRDQLAAQVPISEGFLALRAYLINYIESDAFRALSTDTHELLAAISALRYDVFIEGNLIEVRPFEDDPDYGEVIARTFEKFRREDVKEYQFSFASMANMNHVEAAVLDRVALLFPAVFASLAEHRERHRQFIDPTIRTFDREIHFYVSFLRHIGPLQRAGLHFCYPKINTESKEISACGLFDLALAHLLVGEKKTLPVTNDFTLTGTERILVVTGPNQGGKTTFARAFGQIHYLACLGCPVPAREACLFLFDQLFTHFEREESVDTLTGKLEQDLRRFHHIVTMATARSIFITNESFSSTTVNDALFLNRAILRQLIERDAIGVVVTFLDELASLGPATVSMTSMVDPADLSRRTFQILRLPANGLAYALALAEKYRLTQRQLQQRLAS